MLVFLWDSTGVLSRHAGSGETPEINLWLRRLYCLCTYIPLNPNRNNYVALAWNVCQLTKGLENVASYNQAIVKPRWFESWTILLEVLDFFFTNKVHSKSWSSTNVSPSVVVATTTLQKFFLACFGASLPTFHRTLSCFIKHSSFSVFLTQMQPVDHSWSIPLIGHSPRLGPAAS